MNCALSGFVLLENLSEFLLLNKVHRAATGEAEREDVMTMNINHVLFQILLSWNSKKQTSLNILWWSRDQQDVNFDFKLRFPLVLYCTLFFCSFSHLPAKQYSEGKTWWRIAAECPAKESYKCICLTVLRETFKHRLFQWFFSLPGNRSPTHLLEVALLPVLWIYTFLFNFLPTSSDLQISGKKITTLYAVHMKHVSILGALGVTEQEGFPFIMHTNYLEPYNR